MSTSIVLLTTVWMWIFLESSTNIVSGMPTKDVCACTLEYHPYCGSDLNTYSNLCGLACAMMSDPGLHAICSTPCPCSSSEDDEDFSLDQFQTLKYDGRSFVNTNDTENYAERCFCPKILDPVCGSNNVTYENECLLICDQHQNNITGLIKTGNGECTATSFKKNSPLVIFTQSYVGRYLFLYQ